MDTQAALCDHPKREELFSACNDFVPDWDKSVDEFNILVDELISSEGNSEQGSNIDTDPEHPKTGGQDTESCLQSLKLELDQEKGMLQSRSDTGLVEQFTRDTPDASESKQFWNSSCSSTEGRQEMRFTTHIGEESNHSSKGGPKFEGSTLRSLIQELLGIEHNDSADPVVLDFLERATADLLEEESDCGNDLIDLIDGCLPESLAQALANIDPFLTAARRVHARLKIRAFSCSMYES
jgi:hypothetical protein